MDLTDCGLLEWQFSERLVAGAIPRLVIGTAAREAGIPEFWLHSGDIVPHHVNASQVAQESVTRPRSDAKPACIRNCLMRTGGYERCFVAG